MNIRANNVSLSINGRRILSNVTLLAEGGKMTALTGKSGSGKTTLLNCLGLIHPIDSGRCNGVARVTTNAVLEGSCIFHLSRLRDY